MHVDEDAISDLEFANETALVVKALLERLSNAKGFLSTKAIRAELFDKFCSVRVLDRRIDAVVIGWNGSACRWDKIVVSEIGFSGYGV